MAQKGESCHVPAPLRGRGTGFPYECEGSSAFRRSGSKGSEGSKGGCGRLMDKPLCGLRVDGPLGRRFLRGLSLTRLWRKGCCRAPLNYRRCPLMKKPLQLHLLKLVPPACKRERTMKWRGRPPIGGQDSDRVSHRCSALYTLLPLRGISPQGETRNLRRKTESHILHVPLRHSPFGGWRHHLLPTVRWHNTPCLLVEPLTK